MTVVRLMDMKRSLKNKKMFWRETKFADGIKSRSEGKTTLRMSEPQNFYLNNLWIVVPEVGELHGGTEWGHPECS